MTKKNKISNSSLHIHNASLVDKPIPLQSEGNAGPSSSSVSASFPYIPLPAHASFPSSNSISLSSSVSPSAEFDKSSPAPPASSVINSHTRIGSLSSNRPMLSGADSARAEYLFHQIISAQSAARGCHLTDVWDAKAPWRTDDSLISPELWKEYGQVPIFIETMLEFGDSEKVDAKMIEELARYVSLARFGDIEQNAWRIFKRICKQKRTSRAMVWLNNDGSVDRDWTFGEFYSRVCRLSLYIKDILKLHRGDRAILAFVPGLEFYVTFWACLSQGVVAVPVTPVDPFHPQSDVAEKLAHIVSSCQPAVFFTCQEYVNAMEAGKAYLDTMSDESTSTSSAVPFDLYGTQWISVDGVELSKNSFDPSEPFADNIGSGFTLAFLQYTSGSTGHPKGVMVGHGNLVSNVAGCTEETRAGRSFANFIRTVAVSWLPSFHDMGLMGFHCAPILTGTPVVYFSPLDFLANPCLWMKVLSHWSHHKDYSFVTTGGPPFALDLIAKKFPTLRASEKNSIDLFGVISIILGAEPIRASSMLGFTSVMQDFGFTPNAFMCAFGLAENVLHVIGKKDNTYPPTLLCVSQQSLSEGFIQEYDVNSKCALLMGPCKWLVSCGELFSKDPSYWQGMKTASGSVVVVNPQSCMEQPDGVIGEIWITGKCVTAGYWNNAEANSAAHSARLAEACTEVGRACIKASFYRTGDLGVWYKNELYITGRLKEMLIVNGTKHYPADIEEAIKSATDSGILVKLSATGSVGSVGEQRLLKLRPGGILATEMENTASGKNDLIIMVELVEPDSTTSGVSDSSTRTPVGSKKTDSPHSSDGMTASQVKFANTLFKQCQKLPTFLRAPTVKCLARLGACYQKYAKAKAAATTAANAQQQGSSNERNENHAVLPVFSAHALDQVEKAVRRAVMGRFGIPVPEVIVLSPRSILKTSSGKIRRLATCQLLASGGLKQRILRRSNERVAGTASNKNGNASQAWIVKPSLSLKTMENERAVGLSSGHANKNSSVSHKQAEVPAVKEIPSPDSLSNGNEFELVNQSASPSSSSSFASVSPPVLLPVEKLDPEKVKHTVAKILGEELELDAETVLVLSNSFSFEDGASLDEYGLDSLTAMKIAGRLTLEFGLLVPISPFMFFADPTLDGMVKLICRLKDDSIGGKKISSAKDFQIKQRTHGSAPDHIDEINQVKDEGHIEVELIDSNATTSSSPVSSQSSSSNVGSSGDSVNPFILGIGCCVPGPGAPQNAIMSVMVADMELPAKKSSMFTKIGESSGIDRRYSVLPTIESIYFGRKGVGNNESVDVRNAIFKSEAPPLSLDAARAAIADWGLDKSEITHVVAVTCTGVIVPGLEFQVLSGLGLSSSVQRLSVTFMGCFGALSGMKAARAFACENVNNRVLLVCTELCSLHMQLDDRIDNLVGSALFADGSGAMIIGANPRPGEKKLFEMHRNASVIIPETLDMMAWELTSTGMVIGLGKEIPDQIYRYIDSFSASMLSGTAAEHVDFNRCLWAIHPGGPMILTAIADRLGLSSTHTASAWTVLRKYGNMSSATLIFVLREMLQQFSEGEDSSSVLPNDCSPFVPALAFGPGLNVEGCLLKYCGAIQGRYGSL